MHSTLFNLPNARDLVLFAHEFIGVAIQPCHNYWYRVFGGSVVAIIALIAVAR
jgi:hypothetical protein